MKKPLTEILTPPIQHSFRLRTPAAEAKLRAFLTWRARQKATGAFHGATTLQEVVVEALGEYMDARPGWEADLKHEVAALRKAARR